MAVTNTGLSDQSGQTDGRNDFLSEHIAELNHFSGENFYLDTAQHLASLIKTRYVMITQYHSVPVSTLKTLAFWDTDQLKDNFEFMTEDTPCGEVIAGDGQFHFFADNVQSRFPDASGLAALQANSYAAAPMFDSQHNILGHIAILDTQPLNNESYIRKTLELYAQYVGIELEKRQTLSTIDVLTKGFGLPLGQDCFDQLVQLAADTFDVDYAFIGKINRLDNRTLDTLSLYHRGEFLPPVSYCLDNTPCDIAINNKSEVIPANLQSFYPEFPLFKTLSADGYVGIALFDSHGEPIGVFGLIRQNAIKQAERVQLVMDAFGNKAAYEIERVNNEQALKHYSGIVSTTDDFMAFIDTQYVYQAINDVYCQHFSKPRNAILGNTVEQLHGAELFHTIKQTIDSAIELESTAQCDFWRLYPDGSEHFIQCKYTPYYDGDELIGVCVVARDLTELKTTQDALLESEQRLQSLYDDTPSMFFTIDHARNIKSVNAFGAKQLGYPPAALTGRACISLIHEEDHELWHDAINRSFANPDTVQHWELRKRCRNGHIIWVKETARLVYDTGNNAQLFIVSEDISERHKLSQRLSYQASHDALTGLLNRHEFERLAQELLDDLIDDKTQHVMCYLDLDRFKLVNDSCGHLAGDTLLKQVSAVISQKIRRGDILARLGGDEFAILMKHCDVEQAQQIAEVIRQQIEEFTFIWQQKTYSIGASIGLIAIDCYTSSLTTLMSAVDTACYAAKDAGRNRVIVYSENNHNVNQRRGDLSWVQRIQSALENNTFCLYAQKIIPITPSTDSKPSYELLLRLTGDDGQLIPPGAFLPSAERYQLAAKIDRWVINHALSWLSDMATQIDAFNYCAINLSGQSFEDRDFLPFVQECLKRAKIPAKKLCFEITETAAISNLSAAIDFIEALSKQGCLFALDDFGSGVSSFGYLRNLYVDFVKIDGGFVQDLVSDPIDFAMVKSINDIAQVMGKKTVAEYVEDEEILAALASIGVDYAQGYGIGHPNPLDSL